jgi:hypothetical protein
MFIKAGSIGLQAGSGKRAGPWLRRNGSGCGFFGMAGMVNWQRERDINSATGCRRFDVLAFCGFRVWPKP